MLLYLLVLTLPALALVASLPRQPLILGVLNDTAHGPVFAALAIVLWRLLQPYSHQRWLRLGAAFLLAVAAGAIVELIQPAVGRGASWTDLRTDALGAIAALALVARWHTPGVQHWRRALLALAFLVATAWVLAPLATITLAYLERAKQFPVLLDASRTGNRLLRAQGAQMSRVPLPSDYRRPGDGLSLQLRLQSEHHRWPGLTHLEPAADWSGYDALLLDLTNPGEQPLPITVRVHDRLHDQKLTDRYNGTFLLPPVTRTVLRVPLAVIARAPTSRTLDLGAIAGLIIFSDGTVSRQGQILYVTRAWLE